MATPGSTNVISSCSVAGCSMEHAARGYCQRHYDAWKRTGNPLSYGVGLSWQMDCERGERTCRTCEQTKPIGDFNFQNRSCRACRLERIRNRRKESRLADPAAHSARLQRQAYKSLYGLTVEEVQQMRDQQSGRCAICDTPETFDAMGRGLSVDHDHKTGRVRSLLCRNCNAGLGQFKESPERLRRAALYLERFND